MDKNFIAVFQTSYFSNNVLLSSFLFLGSGIFVIVSICRRRFFGQSINNKHITFFILWAIVWNTISVLFVFSTIGYAREYRSILKSGDCEMTGGTVQVLHAQPWGGHSEGELIQINDKKFTVDYYLLTLAYSATISHGGELKNGVYARVHYYRYKILKVEIPEKEN